MAAACPELLAVTPEIERYAGDIGKTFGPEDGVEAKLAKVAEYMHGDEGLAFEHLKGFRRVRGYLVMARHLLGGVSGIFFAPRAGEIVKYRTAFGCSHYARAYIAILKALKIPGLEDVRYVVSSSHTDYRSACPEKGAPRAEGLTINGHQFVAVKYGGKWWFINTSYKGLEKVPAGDMDHLAKDIAVAFPSYAKESGSGHDKLLVRYIGADPDDGACDVSFAALMNISSSGDPASPICRW